MIIAVAIAVAVAVAVLLPFAALFRAWLALRGTVRMLRAELALTVDAARGARWAAGQELNRQMTLGREAVLGAMRFKEDEREALAAELADVRRFAALVVDGHAWHIGGKALTDAGEPRIRYECACGTVVLAPEGLLATEAAHG